MSTIRSSGCPQVGTYLLAQLSVAIILIGLALIVAAWVVGPAGVARDARRAAAPFLREHPGPSHAVTLATMALVFIWNPIPATGKPAGMIVFTVLALLGTELLRRHAVAEFPDAGAGDAAHALRARVLGVRRRHHAEGRLPAESSSAVEELAQLAELRAQGAITPDEYQVAKSKLLRT